MGAQIKLDGYRPRGHAQAEGVHEVLREDVVEHESGAASPHPQAQQSESERPQGHMSDP